MSYVVQWWDVLFVKAMHFSSKNARLLNLANVSPKTQATFFLQDLESPPSSVTAVMKNGWLTNGFKETALHTAIWSVLKAKRRLLKHSHGFKAQVKSTKTKD